MMVVFVSWKRSSSLTHYLAGEAIAFGSSFSMIVALFPTCLETIINYSKHVCACIFDNPETKFSQANYEQLLSYNVTVMSNFLKNGRLTEPALNAEDNILC